LFFEEVRDVAAAHSAVKVTARVADVYSSEGIRVGVVCVVAVWIGAVVVVWIGLKFFGF
jgi:hypothetical protein